MKSCLAVLAVALCSTTAAVAQTAGIDFSTMKVGTQLTIQNRGYSDSTIVREYVGPDGEHHVIEERRVMEDGSLGPIKRKFFDQQGRMTHVTKEGKRLRTYTPFACEYVLGDCEHTLEYYNPLKDNYVINEGRYRNRIDGDTLFLGVFQSDGDMFEVPYELGPHNLRQANEYKNALGQDTGYSFVRLDIPSD